MFEGSLRLTIQRYALGAETIKLQKWTINNYILQIANATVIDYHLDADHTMKLLYIKKNAPTPPGPGNLKPKGKKKKQSFIIYNHTPEPHH